MLMTPIGTLAYSHADDVGGLALPLAPLVLLPRPHISDLTGGLALPCPAPG